MNNSEIIPFSLGTPDRGFRNQVLGAFKALSELTGLQYDAGKLFLLPKGVSDYAALTEACFYSKYPSYEAFRKDIFAMADAFFKHTKITPRIFITAYNLTESSKAGENVDMLCRAIKEYYQEHDLGNVFTTVLTSRLHRYKYVDLINVPKHLLTLHSRIRMLQHKSLRKKVLVTIGTINNFERKNVVEKNRQLLELLDKLKNDAEIEAQVEKLVDFSKAQKKVVFCLGGRVEGPEIIFSVNYARKLLADARHLAQEGYSVVFVNGPRTPNDVTDFLYENTKTSSSIVFQNCKKIATSDEERTPQKWRIYSGKHEDEFRAQEKIGNIYPGIIGFDNSLVVHTVDSYASCETANAALLTAISSNGLYINPDLRRDCLNLQQLLCPKYAIDWDDFVEMACHMHIEPKSLAPQVLSSPLRVFAETVLNRINRRRRISKK